MFKSTIKKSNVIINPLKKLNNENNFKKQKTFLLSENNKLLNISKNNSNKQLLFTKDIEYYSKKNEDFSNISKIKNSNHNHNLKKEAFLQKLKDMIFSPGDINNNEKEIELQYNNQNNIDSNLLKNSNRTKSSDKLFELKKGENGATNINSKNLKERISNITNKINLLPNKLDNKKTLVLDLDETLIHSAFEPFKPKDDIKLKMKIKNEGYIIHVLKRPYLDEFLKIVTQKYEVVIFTASISDYANPLLDKLDPFKKISYRLFREHCTKTDNGLFIKDLNKLGRNLKDVIIIDNNPVSYTLNKSNGLPILTWHSFQSDNELIKLIPLLIHLTIVDDVRTVINKVVNGYYVNYKEVNKIIKNNNIINNNAKEEDDYFNNWFSFKPKKIEIKTNQNDNHKNNKNIEDKLDEKNIKRKESADHIIKYKGLLGSGDKFNFDNYKRNRHMKMFSEFFGNDINEINSNKESNINKGNTDSEINNKKLLFGLKNNTNENSILLNGKQFENKRNNSSKALIKINRKNNRINNELENSSSKFFHNDKTSIKSDKNKENISSINYNFDFMNNSKLNITDTNINVKPNIIMNNNTNIINNNIFLINNEPNITNINNNTIEHSSRNIFNINTTKNKSIKSGYKSANYFFQKKNRSQSVNLNQKQNDSNTKNILSNLIDNLINYNKNNKKKNIDSNQLIAISNNSKYLNNENKNPKMNNLILNNIRTGRELYDKFNSRNKEKLNTEEENKYIINAFLNNRINLKNINNINTIDDYKKSSKGYINTGNNYENYIQKNKNGSFLFGDNNYKYKNKEIKDINNFRINKHYTNIDKNKQIKYLSNLSNYKIEL